MDSHCVIGFKAHVLSCRSFPAPVSSLQARHQNTSEPFVLTQTHPLDSILIKIRPNLIGLEAHVLSCCSFPAPVSSLQARLSCCFRMLFFSLTKIRPNLSFSLKHVFYILAILIKLRPKLCAHSNPFPYTHCNTYRLL